MLNHTSYFKFRAGRLHLLYSGSVWVAMFSMTFVFLIVSYGLVVAAWDFGGLNATNDELSVLHISIHHLKVFISLKCDNLAKRGKLNFKFWSQ